MRFLRPDLLTWWIVVPVLMASCGVHARLRRMFRPSTSRESHSRSGCPERVEGRPSTLRESQHRPGRSTRRDAESLSRRSTWRRDAAVLAASVLAASAIVCALIRPQILLAARVPDYERQDLIVMIDRSVSMRARDIRPSRFARATLELRNLVRQKPDGIDRIGLVGFADSSLVLSYLTTDIESVLFYLDWLDEESSVLFGTNIGAALTSARDVARKDSQPSRKRFLLISDGEDHGRELNLALEAIRAETYRVDCIGIGSDQAVPIPLALAREPPLVAQPFLPRQARDALSASTGRAASEPREPQGAIEYLLDDAGRRVTTKFDEATLVKIAATTGGRYLRSTTGSDLARAIPQLVKADRRIVGWRAATEYRDLYPVAIAIALAATAVVGLLV